MSKKVVSTKPIRMWIDGQCFNITSLKKTTNNLIKSKVQKDHIAKHEGNNQEIDKTCDVTERKNYNVPENTENEIKNNTVSLINISKSEDGTLFTSFRLPKLYTHKLVSIYKSDVKELSQKTDTKIEYNDNLTISAKNEKDLVDASDGLLSVIGHIRESNIPPVQFISIPCISKEVQNNFAVFKNNILSDSIDGMHESIFQKPEKLHLTINVLALMDEKEIEEAIQALKTYERNVLRPLIEKVGPIKLQVSGIDCMNNNLKKVDVLYAKAKICDESEDTNLQKIANDIQEYFYERGLIKNYTDSVKLHMTLINTKYRKDSGTNSPSPKKKRHWVKRISFDATTIMEKYRDFDFGQCELDSVHLSLMSSVDEKSGFYKSLAIVRLCSDKSEDGD